MEQTKDHERLKVLNHFDKSVNRIIYSCLKELAEKRVNMPKINYKFEKASCKIVCAVVLSYTCK